MSAKMTHRHCHNTKISQSYNTCMKSEYSQNTLFHSSLSTYFNQGCTLYFQTFSFSFLGCIIITWKAQFVTLTQNWHGFKYWDLENNIL
jgi:hypothetical protein